jgi:hypothetical protein
MFSRSKLYVSPELLALLALKPDEGAAGEARVLTKMTKRGRQNAVAW